MFTHYWYLLTMNNEEIKRKKEFIEEMAKDLFTALVARNTDSLHNDAKLDEYAEDAFEIAEYFYKYKKLRRNKK